MNAPREIVDAARAALDALFAQQRDAFAREPYPDVRVRRDRLGRLLRIVEDEAAWVRAVGPAIFDCPGFGKNGR